MRYLTLAFLGLFAAALFLSPVAAVAAEKGISKIKTDVQSTVDRRKPRVPGGSGCDDPEDIIEHPTECR